MPGATRDASAGGEPEGTLAEWPPVDRPHPNPSPEGEELSSANAARGEAALRVGGVTLALRPSFAALVAAEGEVGPLFAMVERAAEGRLSLSEMVALFWHCLRERPEGLTRDAFADAVAARGLAANMAPLKTLIGQILAGRA